MKVNQTMQNEEKDSHVQNLQKNLNSNSNEHNNDQKQHVADLFIISVVTFCNQFSKNGKKLMIDLKIYRILEIFSKLLAKHPFLALSISGIILIFTLPFLLFIIFATATAILTFSTFVMVEGTLISIAAVLLFGFLGFAIVLLLFFVGVILIAYFGFLQIYDLFEKKNTKKYLLVDKSTNYQNIKIEDKSEEAWK